MTERTTVRLPEPLLAEARRRAQEEGRTLTSLIEEGLRAVLQRARPPVPHVALRPSSVKGQVIAPVDMNSNAAVRDYLDESDGWE